MYVEDRLVEPLGDGNKTEVLALKQVRSSKFQTAIKSKKGIAVSKIEKESRWLNVSQAAVSD